MYNDKHPDRNGIPKPIRYAECPHCHHDVMVRPDGHCLACGKNAHDRRGTHPELTLLQIDNVHRLPHCCFVCGEETQRKLKLSWSYHLGTERLPFWFAPLVSLFSYLPGSQFRTSVQMRLPVCPKCARKARKTKPMSIRPGLDCRLLVHRIFRQQFEQLNGKAQMEWERDIHVGNAPPPKFVPGPTIQI